MAIQFKNVSLADRVFETLEKSILTGEYEKGSVLTEKMLSADLGVSRTPIREALNRLADEDLIDVMPQGNVVRGITEQDVDDAYIVRMALDKEIARRAAENITDEIIEEMRENIDQQEYYAGKNDAAKVRDLDTIFHDLLYAASGSRVLIRIFSPLHHKLMSYRRNSLSCQERLLKSTEEHRKIYEALAARDVDRTVAVMEEHLANAYNNIQRIRAEV